MTIVGAGDKTIRAGRNDRLGTNLFDSRDQSIGIVALVGDQGAHAQVFDQALRAIDVGDLSGG